MIEQLQITVTNPNGDAAEASIPLCDFFGLFDDLGVSPNKIPKYLTKQTIPANCESSTNILEAIAAHLMKRDKTTVQHVTTHFGYTVSSTV